MDSEELSRWIAYDKVDLLPDPWLVAGTICTVIASAFAKKGSKLEPEDFIPRPRPVRVLSGEAGRAFFKGVTAAQEARVKCGKG